MTTILDERPAADARRAPAGPSADGGPAAPSAPASRWADDVRPSVAPRRGRAALAVAAAITVGAVALVALGSGHGTDATADRFADGRAAATTVAAFASSDEETAAPADVASGAITESGTRERKSEALSAGAALPASLDPAALQGRKIIRTGAIELRVDNAAGALRKAVAVVSARGGFLAEQDASYADGSDVTAVFRVPADSFDATLQGLTGLGTVLDAQISSDEVTAQVVDLEARLKAKQAAADRLHALMTTATRAADVLAIDNELTTREADIEAMQAQLNGIQDQVSLSTITVHLTTPDRGPVTVSAGGPSFGSGWDRGLEALGSLAASTAAAIGALLPFTPFAIVAALVSLVVVRRRRRRASVVAA